MRVLKSSSLSIKKSLNAVLKSEMKRLTTLFIASSKSLLFCGLRKGSSNLDRFDKLTKYHRLFGVVEIHRRLIAGVIGVMLLDVIEIEPIDHVEHTARIIGDGFGFDCQVLLE